MTSIVRRACRSLLAAAIAHGLLVAPLARAQGTPPVHLSGPFVHENLTAFLVHQPDAAEDEEVLTLEEALASGAVTLRETGQVDQLVAINKGDRPVFLQAGDVVKGGQQDRALRHDTLLPPRSGRIRVAAFCVEAGRWAARGDEPVRQFSSSSVALSTRKQKLAARAAGDQGEVWASVAESQAKLGSKVGRSVKAAASETSLQLSLEDREVGAAADRYAHAIEAQLPNARDVVGYAFAINGEVSAVDVYSSPALFRKLRRKLVRASAVEALAEQQPGVARVPASKAAVEALLADAESGAAKTEVTRAGGKVLRKETRKAVVFTAEDPARAGKTLRKNYLRK